VEEKEPGTGGKLKASHKAMWTVIGLLILAKLVEVVVHIPNMNPSQQAIFSWKTLGFFVALLLLGSGFAHIIGFPGMWDEKVTNRQRIWAPLGIGLVIGTALLAIDHAIGFDRLYAAALGMSSPGVPFPLSVLVQSYAAACAAILFNLFAVAFSVWFFGTLLLSRHWPSQTFWVIAVLVSAVEPLTMARQGHWALFHVAPVSAGLVALLLIYYLMDLAGAILLRRFGFTATLVMRISAVFVWHIIGKF
jgi:hypothetical protein